MPAFLCPPSINSSMMKHTFLRFYDRIFVELPSATIVFVAMFFATTLSDAQDVSTVELPFSRDIINRYSLDHLPRSLSIRQGADVWFGYDLERAKLYKLWRATANCSGWKSTISLCGRLEQRCMRISPKQYGNFNEGTNSLLSGHTSDTARIKRNPSN